MAQALILVPVLRRGGFRWRPRRGFRGVGLRRAGSVAGFKEINGWLGFGFAVSWGGPPPRKPLTRRSPLKDAALPGAPDTSR